MVTLSTYCFTAVTRNLVGYLDIKYEPARFRWRLDRGYCFLRSHESWSLSLRCTRYGGTGHISWISNWWSRWEDLNQRFFWLLRSIRSLKLWDIYDVKCSGSSECTANNSSLKPLLCLNFYHELVLLDVCQIFIYKNCHIQIKFHTDCKWFLKIVWVTGELQIRDSSSLTYIHDQDFRLGGRISIYEV